MASKFRTIIFVLVTCFATNAYLCAPYAQADDELTRLKERIELLETKLELAQKTIAEKDAEIAKLKAIPNKAQNPKQNGKVRPKSLSDLLPVDTVINGTYQFVNGGNGHGAVTVTITSRDGNNFGGTYLTVHTNPDGTKKPPDGPYDIKGTIVKDKMSFRSHNAARQFAVDGVRGENALRCKYVGGASGNIANMVLNLPN